ncbi:MAG: DUF3310 domain-containing protein [Cloacibacillus sp.]
MDTRTLTKQWDELHKIINNAICKNYHCTDCPLGAKCKVVAFNHAIYDADSEKIKDQWETLYTIIETEICCKNTCSECPLDIGDSDSCILTNFKHAVRNFKRNDTFEAADHNPNPFVAAPPVEDGTAENATHYKKTAVQPIELMQYTLSREELIGFLKGNIMKYTIRAGKKGNETEKDNKKAAQYRLWLDIIQEGRRIIV